ncbi:thrombospondin type-1 domain-containing protein 7B-like [Dendronephthya gigantea]|uniref:thrombospondin type-1 domain-containing protein 7B-like n=1 Tax=Dendronephthya gigantea TaxID=151771 RepID=UPI00106CDDD8|nr:thrombospondin type-1 domain-containing protein 7B-like [Dendronephthya gigantea]
MASAFVTVVLLSIFVVSSRGTQVQWSISLPDKCLVNDTVSGTCVRSRTVQCVKALSGQQIPDYYCEGVSVKPSSFIKCDKCPGRCVVSVWSSWDGCDVACSRKFRYRTRNILWRDNDAVTCPPLLEKSPCSQCAGNSNEFYMWMVTDWGNCRAFATERVFKLGVNQSDVAPSGSNVCGSVIKIGKATRKVKCVDTKGVEHKVRNCLNSKDKDGRITQRPDRSKVCELPCDCHVAAWGEWSGCPDDCSRSEESRTRGILFPPQNGGKACGDLVEKRKCSIKCQSYKWHVSEWGACGNLGYGEPRCRNSYQERVVFCIKSDPAVKASDVRPVADHLCDVVAKPAARQPCRTPCPRDCLVSSWNPWQPCSISCGGFGVKMRVRTVLQTSRDGGLECPSLAQMLPCEVTPCASWVSKNWSPCLSTKMCGKAQQHRLVFCKGADGTWKADRFCEHVRKPVRTRNCTTPCPEDCALGDWGSWGACSKPCGAQGGVQSRKRSILAYPSSTRLACPSEDKLMETQRCNVGKVCEPESICMWKTTTWSSCEARVNGTCGTDTGVQKREVLCGNDMKNFTNETLCAKMSKPAALKTCDVRCPKNCVLSKWQDWTECNSTCGMQGTQTSRRYVLQYSENNGLACPNTTSNSVEVKIRPCWTKQPCYKYTWSVTPWKKCMLLPQSKLTPPTCGAGYQTRNVSCLRSDGKLAETSHCLESSMNMPPKTLKECWKPCDNHCVRTSWSDWSSCPNRCTQSALTRRRTRQVVNLSPARGGFGATCPKLTALDFTETKDCPKMPCKSYKWYTAPFTSCIPKDTVANCGRAIRERRVLCLDQSDRSIVAESFCDQSKKPNSQEDCFVQCAQDCVVASWGKWDRACSNTCGDTLRTRQRTVLKQPLGLGRACPSLIDKQLCRELECTSFTWSVGIWSTCKLARNGSSCGNGTRSRQIVCQPDPAREWICKKQAPKPAQTENCTLACPGECVMGDWGDWSDCVQGMDRCFAQRWRTRLRQGDRANPKKCGDHEAESKNCSCPGGGSIVTSDWSTCILNEKRGVNCGKGIQYRSVKCEGENGTIIDKKNCPYFDTTPRSRRCSIPCPVDCVMGAWGEWLRCTNFCALDAKMQRSRNVLLVEQNGGRKCPNMTQSRPCNVAPCYTYSLSLGMWSKCYVDGQGCGQGSQTRETTCRRNDGEIVALHFCFHEFKTSSDDTTKLQVLRDTINNGSQLSLTSTRICDVVCPGDCFMSQWSDWSKCGKSCFGNLTGAHQTRTRVVILSADAGGKACSSDLVQTRACQPVATATACVGAQWRTGAWQGNETRAVWCETSSGLMVTGACAEQNKPSETKFCSPKCSDPNSLCQEGRCVCKPYYELFQSQCIPTQGCLRDGHCIKEHTVCKNEKCRCKTSYGWNATSQSCKPVQGMSTEESTTVAVRTTTLQEISTKSATSDVDTTKKLEPTKIISTKQIEKKTTTTKQIEKKTTTTKQIEKKTTTTKQIEKKTTASSEEKIGGGSKTTDGKMTDEKKRISTTKNPHKNKEALNKDKETISPEFWKWIGIGIGALVFFLVLAIGFYCYSRRQRKAKHKMMKLKRNTIELVGVLTYEDGENNKPRKV